jgi:AcrR family transcriptional regulator
MIAKSRRERSKHNKVKRIHAAAREIFRLKGFEAATTREIAEHADVGFGTVFLHGGAKGALLMTLVNEDLAELSNDAVKALGTNADIVEQIVAFFRRRYEYWSNNPSLSRAAFREMSARDGKSDETGAARRALTTSRIAELIAEHNRRLPDARKNDAQGFAELFTAIYLGEVRMWLHDDVPDVERGVSRLRQLIELAAHGMHRFDRDA